MRKNVQLNLTKLNENDYALINEWLDNQKNMQDSIINVIMHVIHQVGLKDDVTSFEVQRALFMSNNSVPVVEPAIDTKEGIKSPIPEASETKVSEQSDDIDLSDLEANDF